MHDDAEDRRHDNWTVKLKATGRFCRSFLPPHRRQQQPFAGPSRVRFFVTITEVVDNASQTPPSFYRARAAPTPRREAEEDAAPKEPVPPPVVAALAAVRPPASPVAPVAPAARCG
ncbi:hypothetical protein BJ912DRAFT_1061711 [Pholiota molesta]|nr:hypothetical protein BJ912DRAFT_1061711 [Pholiota molesta]